VSLKFGSVSHGLRMPLTWFLSAVPIGFVLLLYRLQQSIRRDLSDIRTGRPVFEGERLFD
jgi:TRAP-type C4-dicarboxylate transport system permease small subunit